MINIDPIINQTIKELIIECHEDQVGLWSVIASLKHNGIKVNSSEMRHIAIKVVRALLNEQDIVAINYYKPKYYIWHISPEAAVTRIEKEWDNLVKEPSLGDIVSFTSKELAEKLPH